MSDPPNRSAARGPLATHRKALRDYFILDRVEAGIELRGMEVKSIRDGRVSLDEAYADIENGQAVLHAMHVQPYAHARNDAYDPIRPRRLLLHRAEIDKLQGQITLKGHTLVPLKLYLRRGRVKVELGLGKGKLAEDKRDTIKRKTAERDAQRAMSAKRR
jgi:SsrA-binding protein